MDIEVDSFDLRRSIAAVWEAVLRRWWMVILATAATVFLMGAYIYLFPPVYKSSTKILVEDQDDLIRDTFYGGWSVFRKAETGETEASLMTVAPVVEQVIKELDLDYDEVYHPIMRIIIDWWGQSWVGTRYRKVKYYFFPKQESPWAPTEKEIELAKMVTDFANGVSVGSDGNESHVGVITVSGPTPRVYEIANKLTEVYIEHRSKLHHDEAMGAYNALSKTVEDAYTRLRDIEAKIEKFATDNDIKFDFEMQRQRVQDWSDQEAVLKQMHMDVARKESRLEEVEKQLAGEQEFETLSKSTSINAVKTELRAELVTEQLGLVDLKNRFSENSPEVKEQEDKIQKLGKMIDDMEEMQLSTREEAANPIYSSLRQDRNSLRIELAELRRALEEQQKIVDNYREELKDLPAQTRVHHDLTRQMASAEGEYYLLVERQRQAYVSAISEQNSVDSIRQIESAVPPDKPSRPKTKLYLLIAAATGALFGICLAFVVDFFDSRLRSKDEIERIMNAPVYAEITLASSARKALGSKGSLGAMTSAGKS